MPVLEMGSLLVLIVNSSLSRCLCMYVCTCTIVYTPPPPLLCMVALWGDPPVPPCAFRGDYRSASLLLINAQHRVGGLCISLIFTLAESERKSPVHARQQFVPYSPPPPRHPHAPYISVLPMLYVRYERGYIYF